MRGALPSVRKRAYRVSSHAIDLHDFLARIVSEIGDDDARGSDSFFP
jgi:hypothetical protein